MRRLLVTGETNAFRGILDTEDVMFIGCDPQEWWATRDQVVGAMTAQLEEMKGKVQLIPNDVVARRRRIGDGPRPTAP